MITRLSSLLKACLSQHRSYSCMTLSLRFGLFAIGLLMAAVLTVGYLFERERTAALELNEQEHVILHAERAADELQRQIKRLCRDTLFLAQSPPLQALRRILQEQPEAERIERFYDELERLFLAFAAVHPDYLQLRLIGLINGGRELVRIERRGDALSVSQAEQLEYQGDRYFVKDADDLQADRVRLSLIDLNRAHGRIAQPEIPTLRALTPVMDDAGRPLGMVVINIDMRKVFASLEKFRPSVGRLYLVNADGYFLYHPDPAKTFTFERGETYRLSQEFPLQDRSIQQASLDGGIHFEVGRGNDAGLAYATTRRLNPLDPDSRPVTLVLTQPSLDSHQEIVSARRKSRLTILLLLSAAVAFALLMVHRLTHSLRALVQASKALTQGDYEVHLPASLGSDMATLSGAFRHMVETLREREQRLTHLNQSLEQQVAERTRELETSQAILARERNLLQTILDHVGDGVIALDQRGRFLLWNRRAQEIVGRGPAETPPEAWPRRYGLFRSPDDDPMPSAELPLLRALNGETVRSQELFIRNAGNPEGRWISMFARPLENAEGAPEGAVAVLVDIQQARSLREQREAQSRELRRIGQLTMIEQIVDSTTHRLSQPIAAIANYTGAAIQLRALGRLDEQRLDEILNHINRLAERGGADLQAMRSLTLRGSRTLDSVEINQILRAALNLLVDRLQRQHILVEQRLDPAVPKVLGHAIELQQVMMHLFINAMEALTAAKRENRRLCILTEYSDELVCVRIEIGDNGPGIPPELRHKIFEPWFTTKVDALGLGLTVAHNIIETHNGRLSVRDAAGMTWFVIELPALNEADD